MVIFPSPRKVHSRVSLNIPQKSASCNGSFSRPGGPREFRLCGASTFGERAHDTRQSLGFSTLLLYNLRVSGRISEWLHVP